MLLTGDGKAFDIACWGFMLGTMYCILLMLSESFKMTIGLLYVIAVMCYLSEKYSIMHMFLRCFGSFANDLKNLVLQWFTSASCCRQVYCDIDAMPYKTIFTDATIDKEEHESDSNDD
jgi:hypothetical protein